MEPSANPKPFINPLAKTPGVWGQMRAITPLEPTDPPALWSAAGDYYISQAFSDYRLAFAKYLIDHRVFRCNHCNCPMHAKFNWCLCMRCLSVPYCGRVCLQLGQALHFIGCAPSHVWSANTPFRAPYAPEEPTTSSSSSSSSSPSSSSSSSSSTTDGGRNNKKRGRTNRDNSNKPCKFYTEKGSCNPKEGKACDFKHCKEARKAYLTSEADKL
jgi:hypothetical protein